MYSTIGTLNSSILRAPICKLIHKNVKENMIFFHSSLTHSTILILSSHDWETTYSFLTKPWRNEETFLKKQSYSFFNNAEGLKNYTWSKFSFSKVFQKKRSIIFRNIYQVATLLADVTWGRRLKLGRVYGIFSRIKIWKVICYI